MADSLPAFIPRNRRTIRSLPNPLDKSTVVSIYPKDIREEKATMQPGIFTIPAGSYDKPTVLIVGPSSWWREIDEDQPLLEIPVSSIQIAESIIKDYANGLLASNAGDTMPGLFFIPGAKSIVEIRKEFPSMLEDARAKQQRWYQALVRMGDNLWTRTNGNPIAISDDMRLAAHELGLKDKDWMKDHSIIQQVRCVACGALRNPQFPICGTCKAIADPALAKSLNLQFADK